MTPQGGATKGDWGNPPSRSDLILSTKRLDRVIEHAWADMTVTVEAGCTVSRLQQTLAQHRQRLAIDVLWPDQATIGGIISTNDSGVLRLRYGGLRDLIIGVTLALADGTLATSGGKVVKNVAGYDLPKLATGAMGTLGVITQAIFRLHPVPQQTRTLSIELAGAPDAQQLLSAIQDSKLTPSAAQVRAGSDSGPRVDILLEGTPAGISAQEAQIGAFAAVRESSNENWAAREELWSSEGPIAKLSLLPAEIGKTLEAVAQVSNSWSAVVEATGIGWLCAAKDCLCELRGELERSGGSLVILRHPAGSPLDAWGAPSDSLPIMRALKQQFDPRATLNPGRFVAGI